MRPLLPLLSLSVPNTNLLDQLAGITGLGWTAAVLGYLGTVFGYGNTLVARLALDPQSLLYVGGALLAATLGIDRLQTRLASEQATAQPTQRENAPDADRRPKYDVPVRTATEDVATSEETQRAD